MYYNSASSQAKLCINGAWVALGVPRVTVLPASPADGDEIYYVADATNSIVWHLRYNAALVGTAKWEFIGGSPLYAAVGDDVSMAGTGYSWLQGEATASSLYTDLTTVGPSITLPLAGDYEVYQAAAMDRASGGNGAGIMSYAIGGTAASDNDAVTFQAENGPYGRAYVARTKRKTGLAASTTLTSKYRDTGGYTSYFGGRVLRVTPVRVGP